MTQTLAPPLVKPKREDALAALAVEPEHDWGVAFQAGDRARGHVEGRFFVLIFVVGKMDR